MTNAHAAEFEEEESAIAAWRWMPPKLRETPGEVDPRQAVIHAELEAWARWCWEKYEPKTCDSVEGQFDPGEGGRRSRDATISLPENERYRQIDSIIRHMRMHMPAHGEALKLFYVGKQKAVANGRLLYYPCPWWVICRMVYIHKRDFPKFMFDARAAAVNLLRRAGY